MKSRLSYDTYILSNGCVFLSHLYIQDPYDKFPNKLEISK